MLSNFVIFSLLIIYQIVDTAFYKKSALIKFNNGIKSITNKKILQSLLNKHKLMNEYFCNNKLKNNLHESICKYDLNKFETFKTYQEAETMINILYKSNSNICYNILEIYDFQKDKLDIHKIVENCNEFNITYNYKNLLLSNINKYTVCFLNILLFGLSCIISRYSNKYTNRKKRKLFHSILNKINYNPELDICSICHDSYTPITLNIMQLKLCKHIYHYECIKSWLVTHKHTSCPLCNKNVIQID